MDAWRQSQEIGRHSHTSWYLLTGQVLKYFRNGPLKLQRGGLDKCFTHLPIPRCPHNFKSSNPHPHIMIIIETNYK